MVQVQKLSKRYLCFGCWKIGRKLNECPLFTLLLGLAFASFQLLQINVMFGSEKNSADSPAWTLAVRDSHVASPVYGIYRLQSMPSPDSPPVEIVYPSSDRSPKRGIVLLLHACTHNALKFFSPSPACPDCVGLAEELRITRLVQEQGYLPLAVTSLDSTSGCWSDRDIPRLQQVLEIIQKELNSFDDSVHLPIIAIGASSGGYMAAKVAADGVAHAALVMVMGLHQKLQHELLHRKPPLYLAPMPRDRKTLQRNRENYSVLMASNYTTQQSKDMKPTPHILLDEMSCVPLPVTKEYLIERVPGMSEEYANQIVSALQGAGYLGKDNAMWVKDPTASDWRNVLLALDSSSESTLWGKFRLIPGQSPLAKAFHRAWAFHEYCSESILPALNFFESVLLMPSPSEA